MMGKRIISFLKSPIFYVFLVTIIIRLYLSRLIGIWFPSEQVYDDALLINYALPAHYFNPTIDSLLKTMSFSWLLDFVKLSHLSYTFILSCIWIVAALLIYRLIKLISGKKTIGMFAYFYVLFFPTAFELWSGTRLYRNSIIAPFIFIVFYFIVYFLYKISENNFSDKEFIISSIVFGLVFSFTYYIKEDGIWILACLCAEILLGLIFALYNFIKNKTTKQKRRLITTIVALVMPLFIFLSCTQIYKGINYHFFGVYEIETRTNGELGEFVEKVYKVESDDRTSSVWAPMDAIRQIFDASETLSQHPELYDSILHTPWFSNDAEKNPIHGDFLTWVLRTALNECGLWENEVQISKLFQQINDEIDEAFASGTLKEDNRIQLVSSAGGRTIEEIMGLSPLVKASYKGAILLEGYVTGASVGNTINAGISSFAANITNIDYLTNYDQMTESGVNLQLGNIFAGVIFNIYRVVNCSLLFISLITVLYKIILLFKRKKEENNRINNLILSSIILFYLLSFVYTFSITWFSEFIFKSEFSQLTLNFYTIPTPVLLSFAYILSVVLLTNLLKKTIENLNNICRN